MKKTSQKKKAEINLSVMILMGVGLGGIGIVLGRAFDEPMSIYLGVLCIIMGIVSGILIYIRMINIQCNNVTRNNPFFLFLGAITFIQ